MHRRSTLMATVGSASISPILLSAIIVIRKNVCLVIAACILMAPCTSNAAPIPDFQSEINFSTNEFTRPRISLPDSADTIYFDVLGEIYRVPIQGGRAEKIELGKGWKDLPTISPDGRTLAFRSDVDGVYRIWVKVLETRGNPVGVSGDGEIHPSDLLWGRHGIIISTGGQSNRTPHRRTYGLSFSGVDPAGSSFYLMSAALGRMEAPVLVGTTNGGRSVYLYAKSINGLRILDTLTGSQTEMPALLPESASQVRLSADGRFVGYTESLTAPESLVVIDLATRRQVVSQCTLETVAKEDGDDYVLPTYALAAGARIAILAKDGRLKRCSLTGETAEIPVVAEVHKKMSNRLRPMWRTRIVPQILFPTIDASLGRVAFSMAERVFVLDLTTGKTRRVNENSTFQTMPAYSRSGDHLAYVEIDDGVSRLLIADTHSGEVKVADESRTMVHANPRWANCECKIAFSMADTKPNSGHVSKLMALDLQSKRLTHLADVKSISRTEGYHGAPQWDVDDAGLFYIVNRGLSAGQDLVHHAFGGEPRIVMRLNPEVLEIQLSPDYQRMALRYRDGISTLPFSLSADSGHRLTYEDVKGFHHSFHGSADFVFWTGNNDVAWSVQDRLYTQTREGSASEIGKVELPVLAAPDDGAKTAYIGARIISMRGDEVIERGVLVTKGSKILFVGRNADKSVLEGAERVDATGKTIMPGLVDVHFHSLKDNYGNEPVTGSFLFQLAAYGVTTVYDPAPRSLVQASTNSYVSNENDFNGAMYYSAGIPLLGATGSSSAVRIDSIEDARMYVQRLALAGVPLVKEYLNPNRRQRGLIVQAARELGVGITSHQFRSRRVHFSTIEDGYTAIEHALLSNYTKPFYRDVATYLVDSGVSITPTLLIAEQESYVPYMNSITPRDDRYRCVLDSKFYEILESTKNGLGGGQLGIHISPLLKSYYAQYAELLKAGALVSTGSHERPYGLATHWEMWALSLGGAPSLDVIRAATVNGAVKLNLQSRIGSLDAGMDADFIVLNSNPLESIRNTADISRVVRRGRTMQWRSGSRWPLSWEGRAGWDSCKAWNMGTSEPMAAAAPYVH